MVKSQTITLAQLRRILKSLRASSREETVEFRRPFKIALAEVEREVLKLIAENTNVA